MTNPVGPLGAVPAPPPAQPEDVHTARQLWWGITALGMVQLVASIVAALPQRKDLAEQMYDDLHADSPDITMKTVEALVLVGFAIGAVLGLIVAGLVLLVISQLGKGKFWARTVLTVVGIWLVMLAVGTLFRFGAIDGTATLVAGGTAIVQGVLAAGAIYLCHRPDSTAYFVANRRR